MELHTSGQSGHHVVLSVVQGRTFQGQARGVSRYSEMRPGNVCRKANICVSRIIDVPLRNFLKKKKTPPTVHDFANQHMHHDNPHSPCSSNNEEPDGEAS